jgi:preprotein translocase subunit SecF
MDIIGKRIWFFAISGIISLACIISLATIGLRTGVEFSSGSILNVSFDQAVDQGALKQELNTLGYQSALIQSAGGGNRDYIVRFPQLDDTARNKVVNDLTAQFGTLAVNEFDNISPMVASETARNAGIAVAVAAVAMLLYIAWAFRKMPSPFHFGVCAIAGLCLDALVSLGIFSILGRILGWEINLMFITGILAVIGYSINNTVIVFDRVRENVTRGISPYFDELVNMSVVETRGRSFNTSLTTLFALFTLLVFVGASIENFVVVLIIGVISGVFNSTCVAPGLLVAWQRKALSGKPGLVEAKAKS